jgi:hypothetical protein
LITLRKKIPPRNEILAFFGTIVFLIYGWASLTFFWKVPSWLYFLSLGEIAAILSYIFASSLLECTMILFVFLLANLVLPSGLLHNKFLVRASLIVYSLTFWVALFTMISLIQLPTVNDVISFGTGALLTVVLSIFLADKFPLVQKLVVSIGDRLTIFLYLWLPLSLISLLAILIRLL